MDTLLTLSGVAGINFIMGVPGSDDIMLNYQTTSFHDALAMRDLLGRRRRQNSRHGWSGRALWMPRTESARATCPAAFARSFRLEQ